LGAHTRRSPGGRSRTTRGGPWSWLRFDRYGLVIFTLALGIVEFALGLYDEHWTKNECILDISCFVLPKIVVGPSVAYFSLKILPLLMPNLRGVFSWVPFLWGCFIIAVSDDLTQYWYHRLHHEIPWLWRFHRTHHSASYMGMAMASRQNLLYTFFFSQTYLTAILVFVGLGPAAVTIRAIKSIITTTAHSSIPWDRPFYTHGTLAPLGWILERVISTPLLTMPITPQQQTTASDITRATLGTCSSYGIFSSELLTFQGSIQRSTGSRTTRATRGIPNSSGRS
jgi:sterol desaturase/sphingolipid hydroxylase (fatty acid hydroxylase superfamily)